MFIRFSTTGEYNWRQTHGAICIYAIADIAMYGQHCAMKTEENGLAAYHIEKSGLLSNTFDEH